MPAKQQRKKKTKASAGAAAPPADPAVAGRHPAGVVTGIDQATGLPIVSRTAASSAHAARETVVDAFPPAPEWIAAVLNRPAAAASQVRDLMADLVAAAQRLDYNAALQSRQQFEDEICSEAAARFYRCVQGVLPSDQPRMEQIVAQRCQEAMIADKGFAARAAELQKLPMGRFARELRLWYVDFTVRHHLPQALNAISGGDA